MPASLPGQKAEIYNLKVMNIRIHPRNLDLLKTQENLIDRHCAKIRKMLTSFSPDTMDLDISLEKLPRGSQYQTALVLALPQRTIKVEELEHNPTTSLVRAFAELRRRVKRFKSQLNRERLWHKQPPTTESVPLTRWEIEAEANEHLEKLENYVRREIYYQVIQGQLPPGMIEPQAIVDDVFLFITSRPEAKPTSLTVEQWMIQTARAILGQRMEEIEDHRDELHVEESASEKSDWEDEDLNFYQPDESLSMGDLFENDNVSNPEEILEREEAEEELHRSVAALPLNVRESFILFALEGFTSDEVSMMTGRKAQEILDEVEQAREILKKNFTS